MHKEPALSRRSTPALAQLATVRTQPLLDIVSHSNKATHRRNQRPLWQVQSSYIHIQPSPSHIEVQNYRRRKHFLSSWQVHRRRTEASSTLRQAGTAILSRERQHTSSTLLRRQDTNSKRVLSLFVHTVQSVKQTQLGAVALDCKRWASLQVSVKRSSNSSTTVSTVRTRRRLNPTRSTNTTSSNSLNNRSVLEAFCSRQTMFLHSDTCAHGLQSSKTDAFVAFCRIMAVSLYREAPRLRLIRTSRRLCCQPLLPLRRNLR